MLGHLSQWELQGGDGAVLTIPQLPSPSPAFITTLYTGDPKSPRTYIPPPHLLTQTHMSSWLSPPGYPTDP